MQVGSVIRSPEMSALVPALLAAIADPNASTRDCLETLLSTTFVNTIDAPSLALVVPVVHRGLRDRSGDTKKRAARIAGTMCSLTNDPKVGGTSLAGAERVGFSAVLGVCAAWLDGSARSWHGCAAYAYVCGMLVRVDDHLIPLQMPCGAADTTVKQSSKFSDRTS